MTTTTTAAPSVPPAAVGLEALPVILALGRPDAARVTAWVEGVLGWQPIDVGAGGLHPRVRIADAAAATGDGTGPDGEVPTVLLVAPDDAALAVALAVQRLRPAAVLAWPDDRERLVPVAAELLGRARPAATEEMTIRVGGASGGVGTTTVALAVGALASWRHGATLVLSSGAVPAATSRTVDLDALAGQRTFEEASPVPGIPGLRVARASAPPADVPVDAGAAAVVVRDVGITDDTDVLVLRRDAAGVAALERSPAAVAVVLDDGCAPLGAVTGAAGGRPTIAVPRSARVARAGLLQRVPAALPGSYLRSLRPLVAPERARGR